MIKWTEEVLAQYADKLPKEFTQELKDYILGDLDKIFP